MIPYDTKKIFQLQNFLNYKKSAKIAITKNLFNL